MKIKIPENYLKDYGDQELFISVLNKTSIILLNEVERQAVKNKSDNQGVSRFILAGMLPVACADGVIEIDDKSFQNINGEPIFTKETIGLRISLN